MTNLLLEAENISKSFKDGDKNLEILKSLSLNVARGEKIAIYGASGSGKSTLLHILAGLDTPTSGTVKLGSKLINSLAENQKASLRNKNLGFVYQYHHLLPEFTAVENIAMPLLISGAEFDESMQKAHDLLVKIGLEDRAKHKPGSLSGGERQRVAIARAMINRPKCIIADEPTGNLDEGNAKNVFNLLLNLNQKEKTSMILATHDKSLAMHLDKVYTLNQGKLSPYFE